MYEDEKCLVILDIRPIFKGHALVIPKAHCQDLLDAPVDCLGPMMMAAQAVAPAIVKAVKADAFNLLQSNGEVAGQTVFHLHFHILPRWRGDHFARVPLRELERIEMTHKRDELVSMALKIKELVK